MLIWKVIDANPGITVDQLFEKIEHQIPSGYALRWYVRRIETFRRASAKRRGVNPAPGLTPAIDGVDLTRARHALMMKSLSRMCGQQRPSVVHDVRDGGHRTLRPIGNYRGNPDHIDETGTKAGRHLNAAYAYRDAQKAIKRVSPTNPRPTAAEWQAITKAVESLHAYLVDAS